jgi:nucleotidyltransferase substrate binding protein (TIGR01987 family)
MERQGLIQVFEYTYELAWNTIKDYFEWLGEVNLLGSRDVFRLAFNRGLIENGAIWMDMINSRIAATHTYHEAIAEKIANEIETIYYDEFRALRAKLKTLKETKQ